MQFISTVIKEQGGGDVVSSLFNANAMFVLG